LRRDAWRRGYATEGSRTLLRKAFTELGLERAVSKTLAANTASTRGLEKAGFGFEGSYMFPTYPDREMEMLQYAVSRDEFLAGERSETG
jgi:RimJ/RimL family protein N-acetyltransferase